jgi:anaphase-promoting complex subunit 3
MSRSTCIAGQLRQLIYYNLDNNLIRNALFIAGRLHAYEPRSSEAAYLLALCHLQSEQTKAAYDYSRTAGSRGTHLGCSYVLAQACLELGKYVEGIAALDRSKALWTSKSNWNKHSETRRQHFPDAAAVYCLQGKLWQAHKDINKAVECYVEALKLNPFMWDAFLGLCESGMLIQMRDALSLLTMLGAHVQIPNLYKMTPEMLAVLGPSNTDLPPGIPSEKPFTNNVPPKGQPTNGVNSFSLSVDPFISSNPKTDVENAYGSQALWEKQNGSTVSVASVSGGVELDVMDQPGMQDESDDLMHRGMPPSAPIPIASETTHWEPPQAPARKPRSVQGLGMDFTVNAPPKMRTTSIKSKSSKESDDLNTTRGPPPAPVKRTISGQVAQSMAVQNNDPGAPQRRSARLFSQIRTGNKLASTASTLGLRDAREMKKPKTSSTKTRPNGTSTVGRVVSGNRNLNSMDIDAKDGRPATIGQPGSQRVPGFVDFRSNQQEALQYLLEIFAKLGEGHFSLTHYKCDEAITAFNSLPQSQRDTPWVLAQIGRAYYEKASYAEAEKYFARIKSMAPSRLEDTEVYSTILWHLKNDVDLAYLAHELTEIDRLSPQAWCAIGNSFSLQGEHDQALKCFTRATQLNPKFAYAFTLQGHEHVANEEYDKALDAYRAGIHAEPRHYNAWYGLGKVYEKMGKYEMAEQHFRTAANINPTNAVLICCIGMVLEKMKNPRQALFQYARACEISPMSALARFKKARVLMSLQEPHLALIELKILKDIAPDEANVHFLLGRLYKMLREKGNAIKHFTTALNLDPKVKILAEALIAVKSIC